MELTLHAFQLALAGGAWEQRPYLGVSGNWTAAYDCTTPSAPLATPSWEIPLGRVEWSADVLNAERPRLTVLQHVHTRFSDIPDIDAKESGRVWRCKRAGDGSLDLAAIAAEATKAPDRTAVVPVVFVDDALVQRAMGKGILAAAGGDNAIFQPGTNIVKTLGEARVKALETKALMYGFKGVYLLEARLVDPARAPASMPTLAALAAMSLAPIMGTLETDYIQVGTDISAPRPATTKNFPADPNSKLAPDLHMQSVASGAGAYLPVGYLMQTLAQRGLPSTPANLQHIEASCLGAILHRGMTPADFVHAIDAQFRETGPHVSADYLAVLEVVTRMATNVANAADYTSDSRYPNLHCSLSEAEQRVYAPELFDTANGGPGKFHKIFPLTEFALPARLSQHVTPAGSIRASMQSRLASVRPAWMQAVKMGALARAAAGTTGARFLGPAYLHAAGVSSAETNKAKAPALKAHEEVARVGIESWDTTLAAGQSSCDDCEGVAALIATTLIATTERLDPAQARDHAMFKPLTQALSRVLSTVTPVMSGASVSEPYVDTSAPAGADKAAAPKAPQHPTLPMIGSPEDVKWKEGGHAFVFLLSKASLAEQTLRGQQPLEWADPADKPRVLARLKAVVDAAPAWQLRQPIPVGEGTGDVNPFLLPPEEMYRGMPRERALVAKAKAKILMARALRNPTGGVGATALARMSRVETQPYELEARPDPRQRISPFYREPIHLVCPWLAEHVSPLLGQLMVVDAQTQTRGVDMGLFLRDATGARDRVVLVSPHVQGKSETWWRAEVEPRQRATIRQQPSSCWGVSARATPRSGQVAQLLTTTNVASLAAATPVTSPLQSVSARLDALPLVPRTLPQPDAAALRLVETTHASDDRALLRLTIPHWKFEGATAAKDTQEMLATLHGMQERKEILGHVFLRDRALPLCNDQVQLLLVLPVA